MPPLKETRLQIIERNRREIRQRTNKRLDELAQETESKRQGSSCTQQEDENEDKDEDKIEDKIEDKKEVPRVDKIEGRSGLCAWRLCRVCQYLVLGVLFVIMSVFALSVGWHVCSKRAA